MPRFQDGRPEIERERLVEAVNRDTGHPGSTDRSRNAATLMLDMIEVMRRHMSMEEDAFLTGVVHGYLHALLESEQQEKNQKTTLWAEWKPSPEACKAHGLEVCPFCEGKMVIPS